MAESTLTNSKKLRGSIKRQLTDFENILKAIKEDTDIEALDSEGRLNKHLTYWDEFKEIQNKFDFYAISGLAKKHLKSRSIGSLSIAFTSITPPFSISSRNEDHVPRENLCRPVSRFEFPRLQTPTFHGSCDTWFNFHDSFKSICHDNAEISTIHKFYYLKACLKDEAAEIIASLKTTNENYTVAWELLKNRYDNRRFIVESHARSLFEIPRVSREFAVRNLVDNVQKHVRALKALSQPVDTWDTLLILIVKEKLNTYTREKWEESLKGTDVPRFEDIVSFLEQRAIIESDQSFQRQIHSQKQTQYHKQNQFSRNTSTKHNSKPPHLCNKATISHNSKTSQVTCPICSEQHTLLSCSTFQGMSPQERYNEIRKTSFCHNCLKGYHRTIDCRANT